LLAYFLMIKNLLKLAEMFISKYAESYVANFDRQTIRC